MTGGAAPARALFLASLAGCAAPQARTIEPTAVIEPPAPVEPAPTGARSPAAGAEDSRFVLSRARAAPPRPGDFQLNIADKWWSFRAGFLRLTDAQARSRDAEVSEVQAPERFWDEQTAVEAISVWTAVCNECHGGRRRFEDVVTMPPPPPQWGRGEGLFFGARRRYADVFATVYRGGPERNGIPSEMPAWRGKLAKELIWVLLYFLEYQSGGIEGRFPPSLYPRRGAVE